MSNIPEAPVPVELSSEPEVATRRPRRTRRRLAAVVVLAVFGLAAVVGGGVGLGVELSRKPTSKEVTAAVEKEGALRWRFLSAAEIFPVTVADLSVNRTGAEAKEPPRLIRRVGIVPETPCAEAFDKQLADIMVKHGCRTVLRATYLDATGTLVATVGVAVLPSADQATGVQADHNAWVGAHKADMIGLRAAGFPGTPAEDFNDARRQEFTVETSGGPYMYLRTSGWSDRRTKVSGNGRAEDFKFTDGLMLDLRDRFDRPSKPCKVRGIEC